MIMIRLTQSLYQIVQSKDHSNFYSSQSRKVDGDGRNVLSPFELHSFSSPKRSVMDSDIDIGQAKCGSELLYSANANNMKLNVDR